MNTKSLPAVLALVAGFVTCIMSFVQRVDSVVFAKRFIIVCIIFFAIGTVASIIIRMNFKNAEEEEDSKEQDSEEEGKEDSLPEEDGTEGHDETE